MPHLFLGLGLGVLNRGPGQRRYARVFQLPPVADPEEPSGRFEPEGLNPDECRLVGRGEFSEGPRYIGTCSSRGRLSV